MQLDGGWFLNFDRNFLFFPNVSEPPKYHFNLRFPLDPYRFASDGFGSVLGVKSDDFDEEHEWNQLMVALTHTTRTLLVLSPTMAVSFLNAIVGS